MGNIVSMPKKVAFLIFLLPVSLFHFSAVKSEDSFSYSEEEIEAAADSSPNSQDGPRDSFQLPDCTKRDELGCKDQCRDKFDDQFHLCVEQCLKPICAQKIVRSESEQRAEQASGTFCVETQSAECAKRCRMRDEKAAARCTRGCLLSRCPEADPMLIAKESLDPGAMGCERCRAQNERACARACAASGGRGGFSGIAQFGCEKACLMSYCSKSCGSRVPF